VHFSIESRRLAARRGEEEEVMIDIDVLVGHEEEVKKGGDREDEERGKDGDADVQVVAVHTYAHWVAVATPPLASRSTSPLNTRRPEHVVCPAYHRPDSP
jgi:hypothetical protein